MICYIGCVYGLWDARVSLCRFLVGPEVSFSVHLVAPNCNTVYKLGWDIFVFVYTHPCSHNEISADACCVCLVRFVLLCVCVGVFLVWFVGLVVFWFVGIVRCLAPLCWFFAVLGFSFVVLSRRLCFAWRGYTWLVLARHCLMVSLRLLCRSFSCFGWFMLCLCMFLRFGGGSSPLWK